MPDPRRAGTLAALVLLGWLALAAAPATAAHLPNAPRPSPVSQTSAPSAGTPVASAEPTPTATSTPAPPQQGSRDTGARVEGLFKVLGSAIGVIVAALSALVAYVQLKTPKPLVSTTGAPLLPVRVTGRAPWVGPLSRPDWNDVGMREHYFRRVRSWTRTALAVLILAFYGLLGLYGLGATQDFFYFWAALPNIVLGGLAVAILLDNTRGEPWRRFSPYERTVTATVELDREAAMSRTIVALAAVGARITAMDRASGLIEAASGTWRLGFTGNRMLVRHEPTAEGTRVCFSSDEVLVPPVGMIFAKHQRNAERFLTALL